MRNRSKSPDHRPRALCARWPALVLALACCCAQPLHARLVDIRVLHTTDLHGHLLPVRDYQGRENVGGLLRAATLIRKLRAEREHVLLLDCGDLYQGGAESLLSEGRVMTRSLDALGYDAWALGNHEFDWGLDKLIARQAEPKCAVLAANITTRDQAPQPLTRLQPFIVREFDGVRVAVIGLITPGVPSWSLPDLLGDLQFQRSVEALRRIMPAVREARPDIILLATHQGWRPGGDDHANEVTAIAREFPELSAIIGGHSHVVEERRMIDQVLYTQAGYHGVWVGCLDLAFDTVERKLVRREPRVLEVGDQYPFDPELEKLMAPDLDRARTYLAEVVGRADEELPATADKDGHSPVQVLIARSIAKAVDADVVFHGTLSKDPVPAGVITRGRVMDIVPYENRIGIALLTPAEIALICEENRHLAGSISHMGLWGMSWIKEVDGSRVLRLPDGTAPHPRKRFRVAFNTYVLASGGTRFPRLRQICAEPEARLEVRSVDTRAAVTEFIQNNSPLRARDFAP